MDIRAKPGRLPRVLLELRPALDKHAGIPQQTRLLFRALSTLDSLSVEGLIQSSTHALGKGLPADERGRNRIPRHRQIDRLSRIVIMLEQKFLRSHLSAASMIARRLAGREEILEKFEPHQFRDFIWRRLFARSLPSADFDVVTNRMFRVARTPWTAMHTGALISKGVGCSLFPRLDTADFDIMLAETPYPATVSRRTRLVVRYHDAIPLLMPHTISNRRYHQGFHYRALRRNVDSGAWFACVSEATRRDLLSIFPEAERRSVTIHNMVSHDYYEEPSSPDRVKGIVSTYFNPRVHRRAPDNASYEAAFDYLLMVSTIEPRKNHLTLLAAWEKLRALRYPGLKLLIVGSLGWHSRAIIKKFGPWLDRGDAFALEDVPSPDLRVLYKHARATVCPSFGEGFDLSGVESMISGGVVVCSDIPVHREVYAEGAEYFNPYSSEDIAEVVGRVIDGAQVERRQQLIELGCRNAKRYLPSNVLPKWEELLAHTLANPAAGSSSRRLSIPALVTPGGQSDGL